MSGRFVCVQNRNRDGYQVPLALHQDGLLECLVTDYYASEPPPAWLPDRLARRKVGGLPLAKVRRVWRSLALQLLGAATRLPEPWIFARSDRMLAHAASVAARRTGAGLYCYHDYVPVGLDETAPLIVFVFHPLPAAEIAVLAADAERHPAMARSCLRQRQLLERRVLFDDWARADAVVCASSFTRDSVIAAGCEPAKVRVVPYGAPAARGALTLPAKPAGPTRFLFVGQGIQRKGLHHLIAAWQARPRADASLTIVSYRIDPEIQGLIRDDTITLLGYQTRSQLEQLYRQSHVFVMPSLIEGFGLVYCDALAHGCHVIGTSHTGLPDLGLGPDCASLVTPGDVEGLAMALDEWTARARSLDPQAIRQASLSWGEADFRHAIAAHAREVAGTFGASPA